MEDFVRMSGAVVHGEGVPGENAAGRREDNGRRGRTVMHLQAFMELTNHRRKLVFLTALTFIVLC